MGTLNIKTHYDYFLNQCPKCGEWFARELSDPIKFCYECEKEKEIMQAYRQGYEDGVKALYDRLRRRLAERRAKK